jgi:hypothetical protein
VAQNGHFMRRGASTPGFFVNHIVPLLLPLRTCLDQLRLAVPPRGASELQSHALFLSSTRARGTNQNFGLLTSNLHLRLLYARTFGILVNTLHICVTFRAITYMLCAMGQCGLLGFPFRTPRPPGKELTREGREHPEIREAKVKCQPLSNSQSPSRGLMVSTSGVEITKCGPMQWHVL